MRRQLYAIVVMGVLALLAFGAMAYYLTAQNPRVRIQQALERKHGWHVRAFEIAPFDARRRERLWRIALAPHEKAAPAPDDESSAFRLALAVDDAIMQGRPPERAPYDVLELEVPGAPARRYPRSELMFRKRLERIAAPLAASVGSALGASLRPSVLRLDGRFGLELRVEKKPNADGATSTAERVAALVFERSRQFAFVRVRLADQPPVDVELGEVLRNKRRGGAFRTGLPQSQPRSR